MSRGIVSYKNYQKFFFRFQCHFLTPSNGIYIRVQIRLNGALEDKLL